MFVGDPFETSLPSASYAAESRHQKPPVTSAVNSNCSPHVCRLTRFPSFAPQFSTSARSSPCSLGSRPSSATRAAVAPRHSSGSSTTSTTTVASPRQSIYSTPSITCPVETDVARPVAKTEEVGPCDSSHSGGQPHRLEQLCVELSTATDSPPRRALLDYTYH
jgi:hypothetical protein